MPCASPKKYKARLICLAQGTQRDMCSVRGHSSNLRLLVMRRTSDFTSYFMLPTSYFSLGIGGELVEYFGQAVISMAGIVLLGNAGVGVAE